MAYLHRNPPPSWWRSLLNSSILRELAWLIPFMFFTSGNQALAQKYGQALIDSLLTELPKAGADSSKVLIMRKISGEYVYLNTDEGLKYGNQALTLSEKIKWEKGIALSKEAIGRLFWRKGDFDAALKNHTEALGVWQQLGDKKKTASVYIYLGQDYADAGRYSEALKFLNLAMEGNKALGLKENQGFIYNVTGWVYSNMGMNAEWMEQQYGALRIAEETGDKALYAITAGNLAGSLREQGKYREAIEVFKKSLRVYQEQKDFVNESISYNNIGNCYLQMGDYAEALKNHQTALEIAKKINNQTGIAYAQSGIGDVHEAQQNFGAALQYYLLAAELLKALNNKHALASLYSQIGSCHLKLGRYKEARRFFDQSFALCQELNSISETKNYYESIVPLDSATGNWKSAFEHHKLYILTRDSMYNEENTKKMVQTRMQYEFDKKEAAARSEQEKKDALANQELQRQKLIRNGFMGGFAVVVLFAGVFFYQRNKIKKGKKRSDELLLNILPAEVAEELKAKGSADAKLIDEVTVLFSDFKEFTQLSETQTPRDLVAEINACFSAFDHLMQKYGVEKIKTVGDAYMAAGGLPTPNLTHAGDVLKAALEMQVFMEERKRKRQAEGNFFFEARIGIHTGPVVAGIVGVKKFAYDIWGDTVNTAQRMESASEAGRVNISSRTYELVKTQFQCTYRGKVNTKGKGEVDMYFVEG